MICVRAMASPTRLRVETVAERIVIVGAGGHGREIVALAAACNLGRQQPIYEVVGVVEDGDPDRGRLERLSVPLLGPIETVADLDARYVIGIGDPSVRHFVDNRLVAVGAMATSPMVHPSAWIGLDVELAPGVIVCAGAIVTTNVRLGRHTHLNVQVHCEPRLSNWRVRDRGAYDRDQRERNPRGRGRARGRGIDHPSRDHRARLADRSRCCRDPRYRTRNGGGRRTGPVATEVR